VVYNTTSVSTIENYVQTAVTNNQTIIILFHNIADSSKGYDYNIQTNNFKTVINYIAASGINCINIDDLYQEAVHNYQTNIAVGTAEGIKGDVVTLVATLTDKYNKPVKGKTIQFNVGGTLVGTPVTTDVNGIAKLSYTITQTISGTYTILAQFLGDNIYAATSNTNNLKVDYTPTLPDLTVSNLQIPTNPTIGQTYPITVTVSNLGQTDAGTFSNKLYDGTTQIGEIILNSLTAGTNTPITFNWIPTTSGTHTLKIITDANNQITETNENNNQITQDTTVTTPPDLTISNIQTPSNPVTGQTYPITITITNNGGTDAGTFTIKTYDGNNNMGKQTINGLAAGTSTTITYNWNPTTTGTHTINAIADYYNTITETNENNNQQTQQITVT